MVQDGAQEVLDARYAEQVGGERAGERVALEQHHFGVHPAATGHHIVDHVGRRDLAEQAGDEGVVDPLGCDPVPGDTADAAPEPVEPDALTVSGCGEPGSGPLRVRRGVGTGGSDDLIAPLVECPDERQQRIDVPGHRSGDAEDLHRRNRSA